jgi:hypothetical protein
VDKIEAGTLWAGATALTGAWLSVFLFFSFRIAVSRLRHTLWSWTSGRQCVQDYFKGESDQMKFKIFGCNRLLWESDIGEEVKVWMMENWARLKEEKPPWFKPERVPDKYIPAGELEQLGFNRKRRRSAVGSIRESLRESMREDDDNE